MEKLHKLLQPNKKNSPLGPAARGDSLEEFFSQVDDFIKREVCADVSRAGDNNEDSVKRGDLTTCRVFKRFYGLDRSLFDVGRDVERFQETQSGASRQLSLARHYKRLRDFEASPARTNQPAFQFSVTRQLSKHVESGIRVKQEKLFKYQEHLRKQSTNYRAAPEIRDAYQHNYTYFLKCLDQAKDKSRTNLDHNRITYGQLKHNRARSEQPKSLVLGNSRSQLSCVKPQQTAASCKTALISSFLTDIPQVKSSHSCTALLRGNSERAALSKRCGSLVSSAEQLASSVSAEKRAMRAANPQFLNITARDKDGSRELMEILAPDRRTDRIHMLIGEKQVEKMLRWISKNRKRQKVSSRYKPYPLAYMNVI